MGQRGAHAGEVALRLLGTNLSAGHGDASSNDRAALLAVPANPVLNLLIADWMTETRHAEAVAMLVAIREPCAAPPALVGSRLR